MIHEGSQSRVSNPQLIETPVPNLVLYGRIERPRAALNGEIRNLRPLRPKNVQINSTGAIINSSQCVADEPGRSVLNVSDSGDGLAGSVRDASNLILLATKNQPSFA